MRTLTLILLLAGCHLQPPVKPLRFKLGAASDPLVAADRAQCASYDRAQLGWALSSIIFGVLGGGSGVVTALVPEDSAEIATGVTSLGLSLFAGISTYLTTYYTRKYAESCTVNTGGRQ